MENVNIRKAVKADLLVVEDLLIQLKLPREGVADHINNFFVLLKDEEIIGSIGFEIYEATGLLRSLAVKKDQQGKGYGSMLYNFAIAEARGMSLREIVLLTETAANFFANKGFQTIKRDSVSNIVKESVEFKHACPVSATCMRLQL